MLLGFSCKLLAEFVISLLLRVFFVLQNCNDWVFISSKFCNKSLFIGFVLSSDLLFKVLVGFFSILFLFIKLLLLSKQELSCILSHFDLDIESRKSDMHVLNFLFVSLGFIDEGLQLIHALKSDLFLGS